MRFSTLRNCWGSHKCRSVSTQYSPASGAVKPRALCTTTSSPGTIVSSRPLTRSDTTRYARHAGSHASLGRHGKMSSRSRLSRAHTGEAAGKSRTRNDHPKGSTHRMSEGNRSVLRRGYNRCVTWLRKAAKSAASVIPESWSMTIRNLSTNIVTWVGLSLMALGGRVLRSSEKSKSAESSAPTATASTPSSSRGTTRTKTFRGNLERSAQGLSLTYDNPHDFLHDVVHGKIHPRDVSLEQWLVAHGFAMIDQKLPQLHTGLMIGGQQFMLHHCIESIHYPNMVRPLQEHDH